MLASSMAAVMCLVLVFPSSVFPFQQQQSQQAEAAATSSSSSARIPPAFIVVDGEASKLQLENGLMQVDEEERLADYSRPPQGTVSFGEHFRLLVPQSSHGYQDVKDATLWINTDKANANDDFHARMERLKVKEPRHVYRETYVINAPDGVGDGFTASDKGLKAFLWWDVSFTDGTSQTYVAIVILKGDPCQEHGWNYDPRNNGRCIDPNF